MPNIIGMPNRVMNAIGEVLLNDTRILNFLYYTNKDDAYANLLEKEPPVAGQLIDNNVFIGRRIPSPLTDVGAFMAIRTSTYRPNYMATGDYTKIAQIDIEIICHNECQRTMHGTRDITLVALIQDALEKSDLTGIGKHHRIVSVSDLLGMHVHYSGYIIKLEITGFSNLIYE